ncbi:hypothetical protein HDK77DRAFT_317596 [Phyllosticta capitalensis]
MTNCDSELSEQPQNRNISILRNVLRQLLAKALWYTLSSQSIASAPSPNLLGHRPGISDRRPSPLVRRPGQVLGPCIHVLAELVCLNDDGGNVGRVAPPLDLLVGVIAFVLFAREAGEEQRLLVVLQGGWCRGESRERLVAQLGQSDVVAHRQVGGVALQRSELLESAQEFSERRAAVPVVVLRSAGSFDVQETQVVGFMKLSDAVQRCHWTTRDELVHGTNLLQLDSVVSLIQS